MPRKQYGEDIPGKFAENRNAITKRVNANVRKDSIGRLIPSFRKTANYQHGLEVEDNPNYLKIKGSGIDDGQYIADLFLEAIQRYHRIGHYDEVIAAQETAFDTYITTFVKVFGNLIPMEVLHTYLTNPPIDETNATTFADGSQANCKVALYEKDTIATELLNMERSGVLVPPALMEILKKAVFVVEEHHQEKSGATYSSGSNYVSRIPWATLANHQTLVGTLVTNLGKMKKYCNMFGVPLKPFKVTDLADSYTVYQGWDHPDLDIYCDRTHFLYRDTVATNTTMPTENPTTANWRFIFNEKVGPEDAIDMHVICKLFGYHDATYNKWGDATTPLCGTAQDSVDMCKIYQDDSSQGAANGFDPVGFGVSSTLQTFFRFTSMYNQTGLLNVSVTGTDLTGDTDMPENFYLWSKGYHKYGLFANTKFDSAIVEWAANKMQLTNVKKNGFSSV